MEKLNEKLQRFLELSKEFTVGSREVYGDFNQNIGFTSIGSGFNGTLYMAEAAQTIKKEPTKLEQFEIAQKEKIEKAKRFEEYRELQTDLSNYYSALNKIENNN